MKTILVFDCWLPGFTYINELAKEPGIRVVFVHTSSLQTGQPAQEYEAFKRQFDKPSWVHDFSEFDYCFETLFAQTKPDALLVLSLHHIEARTALYFASRNKIGTYFVPHGIFLLSEEPFGSDKRRSIFGKLLSPIIMLPRIFYYFRFFCKFHAQMVRSGFRDLRPLSTSKALLDLLGRYFQWQWYPRAIAQHYYGRIVDNLILYDSSIAEYYRRSYGSMVEGANIVLSGTLDTTRLIREFRDRQPLPQGVNGRPYAYFISSPYPDYFSDANASIYADILGKLHTLVEKAGCDRLVYRPHPGEPAEFTARICKEAKLDCDRSRDLSGLVSAKIVCGTSSSMLYCAVAMEKPIVIWNSKRLTVCPPYYEPLLSYPKIDFNADDQNDEEALLALQKTSNRAVKLDISKLGDPITDLVALVERQPA